MEAVQHYQSPLGEMVLTADELGITGIWFDRENYLKEHLLAEKSEERETPILKDAKRWLDSYFQGKEPEKLPPLHPIGSEFRQAVWEVLLQIPYGQTMTYGEIAKKIAAQRGSKKMSAQAIGGAVGHNPISILIPCHRVVGATGNLTGYAGGLDKKVQLLTLEGVETHRFFLPKEKCKKEPSR